MRLRGFVALEIAAGLLLAAVMGAGVHWGVGEARAYFTQPAQAAEHLHRGVPSPGGEIAPVDRAGRVDPRAANIPLFHGVADEVLVAPLRTGRITRIKFNRGGSSISLRVDFYDGARAAFKPRQTNPQTVPRKEIAAYRLNRLLGLNTVPPAIGRAFDPDEIYDHIDPDHRRYIPRLRAEITPESDGKIVGELSWWIPVIEQAYVEGFRIDSTEGIVTWVRWLKAGARAPAEHRALVRQLSDMLVFDFWVNNVDRWSGANARVSADGRKLYYMDNTLSFGGDYDGDHKSRIYLSRTQRFSRSFIGRLRALNETTVRAVLEPDRGPFDYLLTEVEIEALMSRRKYVLNHVDSLIAEHGYDAVMPFP